MYMYCIDCVLSLFVTNIFCESNCIDLRPAFHWNLKQLFVFVLAEYESEANVG